MTESPSLGYVAMPALIVIGRRSRGVELEALVDERVPDCSIDRLEGGDGRRRGDDEELVRPVPAEHGRRVGAATSNVATTPCSTSSPAA